MKALCIGKSAYHFQVAVDSFAKNGETIETNEVLESSAGSAVTAARVLGKYGVETYIASTVGDDTFGNIIKKDLEKSMVHTEYMETAFDKRTSITFNTQEKKSKESICYNLCKEKILMKKTDFPMEPDLIYTDGYDYGASLAALNRYSDKISILNAKELSNEVLELSKYCKYIIATKEFAEWVTGIKGDFENSNSLVAMFSSLLNKFVGKQVIVTLGNKGALYVVDGQIRVMPSVNVELVDASGAGDIFKGAFAYALLQGYPMEKAITFANIAGGLSVSKTPIRDSIADLSEIMGYFNQKYPENKETESL